MAFEDMTVAELKDLLRERGLPVSGRKADLIIRLNEVEESPVQVEPDEASEASLEGESEDAEDEDYES
ncbi:MAG: SAP domain-containing protein, partial [Candidatus Thermoplasmatota archaeon]|nr:SAP domain-containing protein [Candidatus Thermoplasmatota archaeon]